MKSRDFDNVDDLALDGVTAHNYAYYARNLGYVGIGLALVGYFACQVIQHVLLCTYYLYFLRGQLKTITISAVNHLVRK